MAMNMGRAFNAKMLSKHTRYSITAGEYNDDNDWIEGENTVTTIYGVNRTGNKFSQFDEGVAAQQTDAGRRYSNYRTLHIDLNKNMLDVGDKVGYKGKFYNILQMSPEDDFSFRYFLLEEDKDWVPPPVVPPVVIP